MTVASGPVEPEHLRRRKSIPMHVVRAWGRSSIALGARIGGDSDGSESEKQVAAREKAVAKACWFE